MDVLNSLWGQGHDLGVVQMAVRAGAMFFVVLILLRLAGKRVFGHKSPSDHVVTIMIGAVGARVIVGASPFWPCVAASGVLVLVDRMLIWLGSRSEGMARLLNGQRVCLYARGRVLRDNLRRARLSEHDLHTSLRLETRHTSLAAVAEAYLETNGRISFIDP
jgi:uncharacterized membrane protein YcaP (DUF421 family)